MCKASLQRSELFREICMIRCHQKDGWNPQYIGKQPYSELGIRNHPLIMLLLVELARETCEWLWIFILVRIIISFIQFDIIIHPQSSLVIVIFKSFKPRCEPWCWNIYLHNWAMFSVNVGLNIPARFVSGVVIESQSHIWFKPFKAT